MVEQADGSLPEGPWLQDDPVIAEGLKPEWISTLMERLRSHSLWTYDHSIRVGKIAAELALHLEFSEEDQLLMVQAGILHDIGKLRVPLTILNKTKSELPQHDQSVLDDHPRFGFELVVPHNPNIAFVIVGHHEQHRRNYPRSIRREDGERTGILQNVLALADSTDALLSQRPYKDAWKFDEVRTELTASFDPELIEIAMQAHTALAAVH